MTATAAFSHALVLTAGLGTRLRPLTSVRAKPAIPVAGEPIVRRIIRWLAANGVTQVTLNLHHLPETIASVVGNGSDLDASVRYSWEQPQVLGSAGGPRQALDIVGADTFFLINGDTLTDLDLRSLADAHRKSGAQVTLALVPNVEPLRYGGVRLGPDGGVVGFVPRGPAAAGSFHFIGAQVVSRSVFADLPLGQPVNSIGGCYDALIARVPGSIRGVAVEAGFWDIGTVSDYWKTSWEWSTSDRSNVSATAHLADSAELIRSICWDLVKVGERARLEECIVTDGVHVPPGAHYRRKIIMRGREGATLIEPLEIE